jgi:Lrp/AsnC family leucine-responsive transcriptional regulator
VKELDKKIIKHLQQDARNITSGDIAEKTEFCASTIRRRIKQLEDQSIIKGYTAEVNYTHSDHPIRMMLFCTAPIPDVDDLVEDIKTLNGVVKVQELVRGQKNLLVTVIGDHIDQIKSLTETLCDKGLAIHDQVHVKQNETSTTNHFSTNGEQAKSAD